MAELCASVDALASKQPASAGFFMENQMPSTSENQRKLMEAAAAGRSKKVPRSVAQEFVREDRRKARKQRRKQKRRYA